MSQRSLYPVIARVAALLVAASFLVIVPQAAAQDALAEEQTTSEEQAAAQDRADEDPAAAQESDLMTVGVQGGRYGVGLASAWPAYGVSGTLQVSETLTAEAIVGFLGAISNFSARGWYRFTPSEKYDLYGYGSVGVLRYDYSFRGAGDTESVLGLGAGAGIEVSLAKLFDDEDFPPSSPTPNWGCPTPTSISTTSRRSPSGRASITASASDARCFLQSETFQSP